MPDVILWLLHSGMRRSEFLNLKWEDIIETSDGRKIVQIKQSKSDKYRTIICTDTMKKALVTFKKLGNNADKVFPFSLMTLRRRWEKARDNSGLKGNIVLHDLRASNITYGISAGVDLITMAGRSGHSNLEMIQNNYGAVLNSASNEAAEKIEKVFGEMTSGRK